MALFQVFLVLVLATQCPKVKAGCKKHDNHRCTEHQLLHNDCPDQLIPPSKHESPCDRGAVDRPSDDLPSEEGWNFAVRGEPGVDFPNFKEIPRTSFSCKDQKYVPGFYADVETGCQVFHVCYEHRQESFLCPEGTIFSQPLLTCDYWYSADCSRAASYYDGNAKLQQQSIEDDARDKISDEEELLDGMLSSIIDSLLTDVRTSEEKPIIAPTEETQMKKGIAELPLVPPVLDLKPSVSSVLKSPVVVPVKPIIAPVVVPVKPKPIIAPVVVPVKPVISPVATAIKSKPEIKPKVMSKAKVNLLKSFVPIKAKVVSYPILKAVASAVKLPLKMAAAQKPLAMPPKSILASKPLLVHPVAAKTQMAVSPLTKKLLAASYLKLLKIHKLKSALWGLKG